MNHLKYVLESKAVLDLLESNSDIIDERFESYVEFVEKIEGFIYENLGYFTGSSVQEAFFNIKKFTLDESLKYLQEISIGLPGAVGIAGAGVITWSWFSNFISNLWDSVTRPFKSFIPFVLDDNTKEAIVNVTIEEKNVLVQPEPKDFIDSPLLTLLALASIVYVGSDLHNQYSEVSKIANLKEQIIKVFERLVSMGVKEAGACHQLNQSKYDEHIIRCKDTTKPFGVFEINISCPLDAYLTYCANMILSLAGIYISRVGKSADSMRLLLSNKDEFAINQMLTMLYNRFISAIQYIYVDEPQFVTKWKAYIDNNIEKFSANIKPPPIQQNVRQDNKPFKRY